MGDFNNDELIFYDNIITFCKTFLKNNVFDIADITTINLYIQLLKTLSNNIQLQLKKNESKKFNYLVKLTFSVIVLSLIIGFILPIKKYKYNEDKC
jgi:hypothetical protein